jgi:hypothetical protein
MKQRNTTSSQPQPKKILDEKEQIEIISRYRKENGFSDDVRFHSDGNV